MTGKPPPGWSSTHAQPRQLSQHCWPSCTYSIGMSPEGKVTGKACKGSHLSPAAHPHAVGSCIIIAGWGPRRRGSITSGSHRLSTPHPHSAPRPSSMPAAVAVVLRLHPLHCSKGLHLIGRTPLPPLPQRSCRAFSPRTPLQGGSDPVATPAAPRCHQPATGAARALLHQCPAHAVLCSRHCQQHAAKGSLGTVHSIHLDRRPCYNSSWGRQLMGAAG